MGIKKFTHEFKAKVSRSRLFKALITHPHEVLPKCTESIKSIEIIDGSGVTDGCIIKATLPDGIKKHRIDSIEHGKYECEYTLIEGDVLGDELEKVCHNMKFHTTEDGGCVIKVDSEYHTKGDIELKDDDIKADVEKALALYNACEAYLIANPNVFAQVISCNMALIRHSLSMSRFDFRVNKGNSCGSFVSVCIVVSDE